MHLPLQAQAEEIQRRKEWLVNYLQGVMLPDDALLLKLIDDVNRQALKGQMPTLDRSPL